MSDRGIAYAACAVLCLCAATCASAWGAASSESARVPAAHDSDLDPVLVSGVHTSDLSLLTEPILDTPQSITFIPEEVMQLQASSDLRDVLRNASSVSAHADEDTGQGTNVQIRGFSAHSDMYLDGQLDFGSYYRDPFNLEEVEVLTGPSAVLFGRGSTGGAIDQVTKKPRADEFVAGTASIGTDALKRVTTDVNIPLQDGGAFRLAAMAQDGGVAGREVVGTKRVGVAPSLTIRLNGRTQLTFSYFYQGQWDKPDYGVPWIDIGEPGTTVSHPAQVPADNFYGFPGDYSRVTVNLLTASMLSALTDTISLRNQLRYGVYDQNYRIAEPGIKPIVATGTPLDTILVTRTERGGRAHQTFLDDQLIMNAAFETVGLRHSIAFGLEAGRQVSDPTVLGFSGVPGTNLITPDQGEYFTGTAAPKSVVHFTAQTQSLFVADTLRLDEHWELNAAARVDRFASDYKNSVPSVVTLEHTDVIPSWRAAVIYKLLTDVSAYAMYGTSFDPSAEGLSLSASTADLAPERSHTVETGMKWDPNKYVLVSGALFKTVMSNLRESSPLDPSLQILAGKARSQGVEVQAQGYVSSGWLILAGFTYMDATILSSPNGDRGSQLQNAPRENLRLFSAFDISSGITLGGDVQVTSSRVPGTVVDPNGFRQEVPGYWTAGLFGRMKMSRRIALQLNLDNLANRRFYDGLDDNHVNVSAGRSARLSLIIQK